MGIYAGSSDRVEPPDANVLFASLQRWPTLHRKVEAAVQEVHPTMRARYPRFFEVYERYARIYPRRMEELATQAFFL
ncbi:hypothetical protein LTR36_002815 [Oleoguttula mirabilis]|uniref:Uncharacterized protein n=1 Tax=Oleoguttula mirabilis TaxID=1507867 RepID=A0AAV9JJR5_9PEZI|nr:hypothetical protein LTR36_002815 [Oleoguttula mirabilis]